ncbi:MAG: PAS domain S-box protein [Candidatus Cloacimonetes bacterium]|nr:PAS domain S-box protein [Candidatus Cloacimonadota bacterium]
MTIKKSKSDNICIFTFSVIIFLLNSFLFAQENTTKKVLILNSYHKGFVQTDNIVKGIESVLKSPKNSIDLIIEYMDSKAIEYGTQYKEKLYDLYSYKYGNQKFDLIISSDDNAFDFLREYHKDLFPDTPIVFCGVNNLDAPDLIDNNIFTGILEIQSVRETIDLALSLHSKTSEIVFIIDDTPTGLYFWNMVQKLFKYYDDILMIRFDSSLSMAQIEDKVNKLSDDTILFFGTFNRDKDGKYYSFDETVSRVSKASKQPMYGNSVQVLSYGIVGGKLFGGFYHGQITAELAQRILKGEKVRDIPVLTEPQTQFMFNYEQLQRFGINTADLPESSIIINKPYSFYEENKILIWGVIVFVALQMLIIILLIINISKRKKAEKNLQKEKTFSTTLVQASPVFFVAIDKNGKTIMMNDSMLEALGYESNQVIGKDYLSIFVPEEDHKLLSQVFKGLIQNHKGQINENWILKKNGKTLLVEWHGRSILDEQGNFDYFFGAGIDITERKKTEKALKESEEKFRSMIESSPDAITVSDLSGTIIECNQETLIMHGFSTKEEIIGKKAFDLIIPQNKEKAVKNMKKTLKKGFTKNIGYSLLRKDGSFFRSEISSSVIRDSLGKIISFIAITKDVTERKKVEEELEKYRKQLEELVKDRTKKLEEKNKELEKKTNKIEKSQQSLALLLEDVNESRAELNTSNKKLEDANKELEAFSYSVSHDLRAPLRHIDGFTKILKQNIKNRLDEESLKYFDYIINSSKQMNQLINDLLIFSRVSRKNVNKTNFNMKTVINEALQTFDIEIKDSNISIIIDDMPDVNIDVSLIRQVWINLISNAIKFTGNNKNPEIHIGTEKDTDGNTIFFIKDNGAGFDQKYVSKIFGVFQRLHSVNEFPGTGIGLANAKRIIMKHGGEIRAVGKINKGASFLFTLSNT